MRRGRRKERMKRERGGAQNEKQGKENGACRVYRVNEEVMERDIANKTGE